MAVSTPERIPKQTTIAKAQLVAGSALSPGASIYTGGKFDNLAIQYRLERRNLAYFVINNAACSQDIRAPLIACSWPGLKDNVTDEGVAGLKVPCLIQPGSLKEGAQAHYSARSVLGLSHDKLQYIRTSGRKLSFSLYFCAHILERVLGQRSATPIAPLMAAARRFYFSLLMPQAPKEAPPLVAFIYPGAAINCVGYVESVNATYERFSYDGGLIEFTMEIGMLAQPKDLMTTGSVCMNGFTAAAETGK
jgi:hypothetical protein